MSEHEPERDGDEGSWLDEVSLATKLVVVLTVGAIGVFFVVVLIEQIL